MKVKAKINLLHNGKKYEAGKEYELPAEIVSEFPHVFEEVKKAPAEKETDLEKKLKEAEKALKAKDKEIESLNKKIKELEAEIQKLKKK